MGILITTYSVGRILIQTGEGVPNHIAPIGSQYTDVLTASLYYNKDGLYNWQINIDATNTSGSTQQGSVYVSGGTYSDNTGIATFTNTSGGTFNVSGFFKSSDDIYSTGFTFNPSNYNLVLNNNDNTDLTVNLGILSTDMTVTGGTYNMNTGVATFTNNTGGTFNVSGFLTGYTDTYITGGTYSNGDILFTNNSGNTFNVTGLYTGYTLTSNAISTALGYTPLSAYTDTYVTGGTYSNGTTTFSNSTGGTFNVSGYYTGSTDVYTTGATYSNNTFTFTNNTGGTFNTLFDTVTGLTVNGILNVTGNTIMNNITASTISASTYYNLPIDVYTTGGTYSNGTLTLINNTGGTFNVIGLNTGSTFYSNVDYIDFNTGATVTQAQGRISWDSGTGSLNVTVGDADSGLIDLQVGQEEIVRVFNTEGTTLLKGEIVYVYGSQGNRPSVKRAIATSDGYSVTTLGMVSDDILSGSEGYVTTFGIISNLNTIGLSGGTPIFLSPTVAGQYTSTKPQAPYHIVLIGYVVRISSTVGSVFVNISNGWELDELHDVRINGKTQGDLISLSGYNGNNVWVNTKTLNGSYTITGNTTVGGQMSAGSISATTYYNLPTDVYTTGATYSNNTFTFTNNSGGTFNVLFDTVTGLTSTGTISSSVLSATTYQNLPTDIYITGGTYNNSTGIATFTNSTGGTFNVTGFSSGGGGSFTGGTVSGATNFTNGLSANTISATTYVNLPKVGFSPINVGVCDTAPTAASTQYYYQTIAEVTTTLSKVKLWGFSGSDLVLFGIYRGSLQGGMTLIGQARKTCGLGPNELTLTAETGQNLSVVAGEDLVVGYYPDGTSWRTVYDVGISDIYFGLTNTTNIATMPATPTGTATGIRFACTLY